MMLKLLILSNVCSHWDNTCRNKICMTIKALLKHENSLHRNTLCIPFDESIKGFVWVLCRHSIGNVVFALDETHAVDKFVRYHLSTPIYHFRHTLYSRIHQFLPQCLVIDVCYDRNFLVEELEDYISLVP